MSRLPRRIIDEWDKRVKAPVITTVDDEGMPNAIYASCVSIYNGELILVANNYFDKTLKNMQGGCKGTFLFLTEEGKSYQFRGTYTHHTAGPLYDDMKRWNPEKLPGVGVAALDVDEIYSGSDKIDF